MRRSGEARGKKLQAWHVKLLSRIRGSFWFLPSLMAVAAVALATFSISLDERGPMPWLSGLPFIYRNEPEAARSLLATVATSMITVTGVVFSVTVVPLTLASQQFGPRLVGNFMRDRGDQLVLGTFISTSLYFLLVLRTIQNGVEADPGFVPHLSMAISLVLTIVDLAVFIYFIHHVSASIQVQNILHGMARDLERRIASLGAEAESRGWGERDPERPRPALPEDFDARSAAVASPYSGYVQAVDMRLLARAAERHGALIRVRLRPGAFVMHDAPLADVYPGSLAPMLLHAVTRSIALGAARTQEQDVEFLFDQLLELALRALSPGINDPFTAMACIDRMTDNLAGLSRRGVPPPLLRSDGGRLLVLAPPLDLAALCRHLFSSLRAAVSAHLLTARHLHGRLAQLRELGADAQVAAAVDEELPKLLASCEARLAAADYRDLLSWAAGSGGRSSTAR